MEYVEQLITIKGSCIRYEANKTKSFRLAISINEYNMCIIYTVVSLEVN